MRLETQMVLLFLLSVGTLIFHHTVPRTELVEFRSESWDALAASNGKGASASSKATDRGFETQIEIVDGEIDTVCAAAFQRTGENNVFDLSWIEKVTLTAWVEGCDQHCFRFFLRNRIPGVYNENDVVSRQYNEVAFRITNERKEYSFEANHFHVPTWWAETYGKQFEHSLPCFKQVDLLELATGSSVTHADLNLIVEEIKFQGHWIPTLVLYNTLVILWLVLASGMMLQSLSKTKLELAESNKRENRLRQINHSLTNKTNELSQLAHHDSLTGLMNRLGLLQYDDLSQEAVRQGNKVSVVVIDVDNFKSINDTRGHIVGDEILAKIGSLLSEKWSGIHLFARWGGEEFVVICFDKDESACERFAEELRAEVEAQLEITCSFGVCQMVQDESFAEAVDRADKAMYSAKARGKNRVVRYSEVIELLGKEVTTMAPVEDAENEAGVEVG